METTTIKPQEVSAKINVKRYFQTMKHQFSSSWSVISELMQNARRAGASSVQIDFDPEKKSLTITDDGSGVTDFGALVALCESGWDDSVVLADNPFGMGFFSTFFACENVTIKSNSLSLTATLKDIENTRVLRASEDSSAPTTGTLIQLSGLDAKLLELDPLAYTEPRVQKHKMDSVIARYARGFPTPVIYNGQTLERPDALDNLKGVTNAHGFFHVANVHDDRDINAITDRYCANYTWNLYLQGLPIHSTQGSNPGLVIHLDSRVYTPVMPDRTVLYNGAEKVVELKAAVKTIVQAHLAQQRAAMDPFEFVQAYWNECRLFDVMELLNDIEFIPVSELSSIESLNYEESQTINWSSFRSTGKEKKVISRKEILDGTLRVYRDCPSDVTQYREAGAILRYMHANEVLAFTSRQLNAGHWIYKLTPSCSDFQTEITPNVVTATGGEGCGNASLDIHLVDSFTLNITSDSDASFLVTQTFSDSWVIQMEEDDCGDLYMASGCNQFSEVADSVGSYRDENETYQEQWAEAAADTLRKKIQSLRGATFSALVQIEIGRIDLPLQPCHLGQMHLVHCTKRQSEWNPFDIAGVDIEKPDFWQNVASALNGVEITATTLQEAVRATAQQVVRN